MSPEFLLQVSLGCSAPASPFSLPCTPGPQHFSQEPQAPVTLEPPPSPAKDPCLRKLVLEEPSWSRSSALAQSREWKDHTGSVAGLGQGQDHTEWKGKVT